MVRTPPRQKSTLVTCRGAHTIKPTMLLQTSPGPECKMVSVPVAGFALRKVKTREARVDSKSAHLMTSSVLSFRSDSLEGYLRFMGHSEADIRALVSWRGVENASQILWISCEGRSDLCFLYSKKSLTPDSGIFGYRGRYRGSTQEPAAVGSIGIFVRTSHAC